MEDEIKGLRMDLKDQLTTFGKTLVYHKALVEYLMKLVCMVLVGKLIQS